MMGELSHVSVAELLEFTKIILSRPGDMSAFDLTELDQINQELKRREWADAAGTDMHPESEL